MTNEEKPADELAVRAERRQYEAPTVKDFFQPVVVLGSETLTGICATPKRPKRP